MPQPRKPARLHEAAGTFRSDRHGPVHRNATDPPRCPGWLTDEAKRVWHGVVPTLAAAGLIAKVDQAVIAAYAQAVADMKEAAELVQKEGHFYTTGTGSKKRHPASIAAAALRKEVLRLASALGLTALSRQALRADLANDGEAESPKLADLG